MPLDHQRVTCVSQEVPQEMPQTCNKVFINANLFALDASLAKPC